MLEWIRKHKIFVLIVVLIIVVGVPLIIHCLYKFSPPPGFEFFSTEWDAGDALQYYGAVLAFCGTVILGALSLYQNEIIRKESDKRIALQEQREHDANMPKFRVRHQSSSGLHSNMRVSLENISDNVANEIIVYKIRVEKNDEKIWESPTGVHFDVVKPNSKEIMDLRTPTIAEEGICIKFDMKCYDKYEEIHIYNCYAFCETRNTTPYFRIKEIKDDRTVDNK